MEKYLEKRIRKYVIASPDYGSYLQKISLGTQYSFTNNIDVATKIKNRYDANFIIRCYHNDTGDNLDLVVIPVDVTYELINEDDA